MVDLDELDRKILMSLQLDGRMPYSKLAKYLRVSESTIYLRIKKLTQAGIIKGFSVNVDYKALGKNALAYVFMKTSPKYHQKAIKILKNIDEIYEIHDVTGEYQLLLKILTDDRFSLTGVINRIRRVEGVRELYVTYVLETFKEEKTIKV